MGMAIMVAMPPGPSARPARKDVYPINVWRKIGNSTMLPKRLKKTKNMMTFPVLNERVLRVRKLTIGFSAKNSTRINMIKEEMEI
jgi:hypothetical protein